MKSDLLHYDLIIPMGVACSCSQSLRRAQLQHLSLPFDWIGRERENLHWEDDLSNRASTIATGFDELFRIEDFEHHGLHTNGLAKYYNTHTGYIFLHDFKPDIPFPEAFAEVKAKYERRISRLYELIASSKRILLFRLDRPDIGRFTSLEECRKARQILSARYPNLTIDILLMQCDCEIPFDRRVFAKPEPGIYTLTFDYRSKEPDANIKIPDLSLTSAALKSILSVRDYRSKEEKRAHEKKVRLARWKKHGATTALGYYFNRLLGR